MEITKKEELVVSGFPASEAVWTVMDTLNPHLDGTTMQDRECNMSGEHLSGASQLAAGSLSWEPWREVRADDTDLEA